MTAHSFMPLITLPTRLSDTCDTLIDNIFTNNSDHQMTCCMLSKNTIEKSTNLLIEVETINQHTLENMRYDLRGVAGIETTFLNFCVISNHLYIML